MRDEDLREGNGVYMSAAYDTSMMFPMLEMAGEHIMHIAEVLYVYNMETPLNEHKLFLWKQQRNDQFIRSKPKYEELEW